MSADAFNTMMQSVDTTNENQAMLAQQVLKAMILGPPTTPPPIPTRTADPYANQAAGVGGGQGGVSTTTSTTTTTPKIDLSPKSLAKNQLSLQSAVAS